MRLRDSGVPVRTKKYVTDDGCYLAIDDSEDIGIGWIIPDDNEFGAYVGDMRYDSPVAPKDKETWEAWAVYQAVKPFAEGMTQLNGFYFGSKKKAQLALQAANDALISNAPWPEWAVRAKAAGWAPPKGWKP